MSRELEDERTWNLFKSLYDCYKTLLGKKTKALNRLEKANKLDISASEVKLIHQNFPQCMHKMFRVLENGGKLKHFQRFYFSLFLKELGMGLHEAQKFWSSYYTKIKGGLCIYCNKIIVIRTDQFCLWDSSWRCLPRRPGYPSRWLSGAGWAPLNCWPRRQPFCRLGHLWLVGICYSRASEPQTPAHTQSCPLGWGESGGWCALEPSDWNRKSVRL